MLNWLFNSGEKIKKLEKDNEKLKKENENLKKEIKKKEKQKENETKKIYDCLYDLKKIKNGKNSREQKIKTNLSKKEVMKINNLIKKINK